MIHKIGTLRADMFSLLLKPHFNVEERCSILRGPIVWCLFNPCVHMSLTLISCNCITYR